MIEKFAGYGFNKSHSTAYALIAYMTAYLKAHYPVEFMAALLSGDIAGRNFKKKDSLVEHLEDCRRMDIEVLPPDVNRSRRRFHRASTARSSSACRPIKGCGGAAARGHRGRARRQAGRSAACSISANGSIPATVNRAAIETLIKAGAFDSLRRASVAAAWPSSIGPCKPAPPRWPIAAAARRACSTRSTKSRPPTAAAGQLARRARMGRARKAGRRKGSARLLSLEPSAGRARRRRSTPTARTPRSKPPRLPHRTEVMLGGMIASIKFSHTKNPRPGSTHTKYAMFDLEDMDGMMRCIVWPEDFANFGHLVEADAILAVRGAVDRRPGSEESNLIVNELIPLEDLAQRFTRGIVIRVDGQQPRAEGARSAVRNPARLSGQMRAATGAVPRRSDPRGLPVRQPARRSQSRDAPPGGRPARSRPCALFGGTGGQRFGGGNGNGRKANGYGATTRRAIEQLSGPSQPAALLAGLARGPCVSVGGHGPPASRLTRAASLPSRRTDLRGRAAAQIAAPDRRSPRASTTTGRCRR